MNEDRCSGKKRMKVRADYQPAVCDNTGGMIWIG